MRSLVTLLLLPSVCLSGTIIQIKDYLCGCKHCESVPSSQPLDIASHMMLCESQREGMLKTIEIMNRTKKPKIKQIKETKEETMKEKNTAEGKASNYKWNKNLDGEWEYSNPINQLNAIDSWVYKPHIGWLWSYNNGKFLYSEKFGWLYNLFMNNKRIFYWYDRRRWILSKEISKYK